jgi:predicted esterase
LSSARSNIEFMSMVVDRHARIGIVGNRETASEVWLLLHGHGMLARGMLHWFKGAEREGRLLVAPEGLSRFYTELSGGKRTVGASWVTREELQNELSDMTQYLEAAVEKFVPGGVPLHVHGFSQGVSAATRWVVSSARPVARLVCWAGTVPQEVTADDIKRKLVHEPLHLVVGNSDTRVTPEQVEADAARFRSEGVPVELHRFAGGHNVDRDVLSLMAGG